MHVHIFTSALFTAATNPDKIYIFGILFDRRIDWLVFRSIFCNFEVLLCKNRPKLPCTSGSVRCTTSKVTSSHSLHQEAPCHPLLKLNVTQYRSGSTVNVNCNGCKSNNAVISEFCFLQNQAFRKINASNVNISSQTQQLYISLG